MNFTHNAFLALHDYVVLHAWLYLVFLSMHYSFSSEIGEGIVEKTHVDVDGMLKGAVNEALESAERRHTRELKAVIHRAQKEAEEEKEKALSRQQIVCQWFKVLYHTELCGKRIHVV